MAAVEACTAATATAAATISVSMMTEAMEAPAGATKLLPDSIFKSHHKFNDHHSLLPVGIRQTYQQMHAVGER